TSSSASAVASSKSRWRESARYEREKVSCPATRAATRRASSQSTGLELTASTTSLVAGVLRRLRLAQEGGRQPDQRGDHGRDDEDHSDPEVPDDGGEHGRDRSEAPPPPRNRRGRRGERRPSALVFQGVLDP